MAAQPHDRHDEHLHVDPDNLPGAIYGTLVVLAVLVGAGGHPEWPLWSVLVLVGATSFVFWLAHVYAGALGRSLHSRRHLDRRMLGSVARHEWPLLQAALWPSIALLAGVIGIVENRERALLLASLVAIGSLFAWGIAYASVKGLGKGGALLYGSLNAAFGGVIVVLQVLVK
jgi:hypothetical protein